MFVEWFAGRDTTKVLSVGFEPAISDLAVAFKFQRKKVSSLLTRKYLLLWGASVTEKWQAWPQTTRAGISNPLSGR